MNKDNTSAYRRRNIVTPAMRKAEEEKKRSRNISGGTMPQTMQGKPMSGNAQAVPRTANVRNQTTASSPQRQVNPTVNTGFVPNGNTSARGNINQAGVKRVGASNPKPTQNGRPRPSGIPQNDSSANLAYERQQQMMRQRQIEMLEKQMREENERRAAHAAQLRRIRELEYRIDQQKLIRNRAIAKEMKKDSQESVRFRAITAVTIAAILIIANIIVFSSITKKDIPSKNSAPQTESVQNGNSNGGNVSEGTSDIGAALPELKEENDKFTVTASDYVNGTLILVNSEYSYNFDHTGTDIRDDELVTVATNIRDKSTFKASNYKILLNRETMDMLNLMMADFYAYSQKSDVMVNTAHRSLEQQKEIYEAKKKQLGEDQKIAQTPGQSEHHTGYAFDLAIYPANENGSTFIKAGDYTWIYENCHKYGFILRYPEGKTAITGIDPESWHFRYVGVPHATYMYNKGKTLEEYITDISIYSESIPLTISVSDTETYSVFYVKKGDEAKVTFSVPNDTEYKISGDNVGGFIVWYNNADVGNRGKIPASNDTQSEVSEGTDEAASVTDNPSDTSSI